MKKILLIIALCIAFPVIGKADACWGVPMTGKNGHTYCVSTQTMKWYPTLGWCDAQGRRPATINDLCDYNGSVFGTNTTECPNLSGITVPGRMWIATQCVNIWNQVASYSVGGAGSPDCPINAGRGYLYRAVCY